MRAQVKAGDPPFCSDRFGCDLCFCASGIHLHQPDDISNIVQIGRIHRIVSVFELQGKSHIHHRVEGRNTAVGGTDLIGFDPVIFAALIADPCDRDFTNGNIHSLRSGGGAVLCRVDGQRLCCAGSQVSVQIVAAGIGHRKRLHNRQQLRQLLLGKLVLSLALQVEYFCQILHLPVMNILLLPGIPG